LKGAADAKATFQEINDAADPEMVAIWEAQEKTAHSMRAVDRSAMDIYEVQLEKGK